MNLTGLRKHVIDYCNVILLRIMVKKMVKKVIDLKDHPLSENFNVMPSGYRYRMPSIRTERYRPKYTFVNTAIVLLNEKLVH